MFVSVFRSNFSSLPAFSFRRFLSILVVAETDAASTKIQPITLSALTAAARIASASSKDPVSSVSLLLTAPVNSAAVQQAKKLGLAKIVVADSAEKEARVFAEQVAPVIKNMHQSTPFTHIMSGASSFGKNLMPRVAALLDVSQLSDITDVVDENTFVRPIYAGNALATIKSTDSVKVLTVRGTAFDATSTTPTTTETPVERVPLPQGDNKDAVRFVSEDKVAGDRPDLTSARIVVSGGRGVKNADNFLSIIEDFASTPVFAGKAAVGATRAAVDAGFCSNDMQIGQTGKIIAPELYFAIGISGAVQHLAGMKDSKTIVAINKDPEAPIFQVADYGLVGDLFEIVPELKKKLSS